VDAIAYPRISSNYQRSKLLCEKSTYVSPSYIHLGPVQHNKKVEEIIFFNPTNVIYNILSGNHLQELNEDFVSESKGSPLFVQKMKQFHGDDIITGFCDSPAAKEIYNTVPENEFPPILICIYADGVDRDQMGHSSLLNRVHITYIRVLNLCDFGMRQRDDYRIIQIMYEESIRQFGYKHVHRHLISKLTDLINEGFLFDGHRHAVRLCFLQVKIKYNN